MRSMMGPIRNVVYVMVSVWIFSGAVWARGDASSRPILRIPRLARAPVVDGVLQAGEWEGAAAISGFIAATGSEGGRMVPLRSQIQIGHDGSNIYLGVFCALPPGVKPTMKYRRRDEPVYMDRYQMEVWLTPPVRGHLTAYQIIGNAYGAIYDARHIPSLGAVFVSWNTTAAFKNHYRIGEFWTAEMTIPISDFGEAALRSDEPWGGMVGIAWPQRSWPYTFGWYKNVETHAQLVMGEDGTAVRVDNLDPLFENRLGAALTLINGSDQATFFTVRGAVGDVREEKTVAVASRSRETVVLDRELPPWPEKKPKETFRLEIAAGDRPLLAGDWYFAPRVRDDERVGAPQSSPEPWKMDTRIQFAPRAMGLKLWADLLDYPRRSELAAVRFSAQPTPEGMPLVEQTVTRFVYDSAETYLWLPKGIPLGEYCAVTEFLDAKGNVLDRKSDSFVHKDLKKEFIWLDGDYGEHFTVYPPFQPIAVQENTLAVWGREMEFEGAFPRQIRSQGRPLLSSPIQLMVEREGRAVAAEIEQPFQRNASSNEQVSFRGSYHAMGYRFQLTGTLDFDGTLLYALEAEPVDDGASATPSLLDRVYLSLAVKPEHARYWFTTAGGWSPAYGEVPQDAQDGPFWTSKGFADLLPYFCFSDDDRGIHWFADHAHEWILGEEWPFAQVVRRPDAAELQVNLVQKKGKPEPFRAQFGFIASPVRPLPSGWRNTTLHYAALAGSKINFFFGPGHGGCPIDPHDTKKLCEVLGVDPGERSPDAVLAEAPKDAFYRPASDADYKDYLTKKFGKKMWETVSNFQKKRQELENDPATVRSCWFFNAKMYFEGNRSAAFRTFFPGEWQLDPPSGWFHLTPTEDYQDFFSFHMDLWHKHWFMPGLYFDEVYLAPDYNVFNGNGRWMEDGKIRPSIPLMQQRRFFRRMAQLFVQYKRDPFIWVHTSNYMMPAAIAPAVIAMFGEDRAPTPMADCIDAIPSLLIRTLGRSQKFGFVPVWMNQVGRGGDQWDWLARQFHGWCWLHDVVPENGNTFRARPLLSLRKGWGIDEDDVTFIPYWDSAGYYAVDNDRVLASAWVRPDGRVQLLLLNLNRMGEGKNEATLTLNPKTLGLSPGFKVYEMTAEPELAVWEEELRSLEREFSNDRKRLLEERNRRIDLRQKSRFEPAYDVTRFPVRTEGPEVRIQVPPRDFVLLVIE